MKITTVLMFVFILSMGIAIAQQKPIESEKAKKILDEVSAKTKSYTTMKAYFLYIFENLQEGLKDTAKGTIYIKGNKYKLEMMGTVTYFDGKIKYVHMLETKEVNIIDPAQEENSFIKNPAEIFTIYNKDFRLDFIKEKFEKSRPLYEIDLLPLLVGSREFSRIKLNIDKSKMQLYSLKYFGKDGNNVMVEIVKFSPNEEFADSLFIFDKTKNPGVEIIDMRQ